MVSQPERPLNLLDTVRLVSRKFVAEGIPFGSGRCIIDIYAPEVYEVESKDTEGRTINCLTVEVEQLTRLE